MPFSTSINNFQINSGNIPLLYPIRVLIPAGGIRTTVSFPDQFLGRALAIKITNNDAANAATYDYNLNGVFANLPASNFATIDTTVINYITVIPGALGSVLIEAQVLPIKRDEVPIEVMV